MAEAFNHIAKKYDVEFTHTAVGKMQRKIVWDYLEKCLDQSNKLKILELNCGTGDDAIWLASKGHKVLATDVSKEMIDVASSKADTTGLNNEISFLILDIAKTGSYPTNKKFDLVFSNFGGFNCISPDNFKKVIPAIAQMLNPKGRFIAVIMPKFCLWESIYFALKGQFSKIFRRNRTTLLKVAVGDEFVDTWYYSPSETKAISKDKFNIINTMPVGIFLPPSYLNNYFSKHKNSLKLCQKLDNIFGSLSILAGVSDHFIIDMEVKS